MLMILKSSLCIPPFVLFCFVCITQQRYHGRSGRVSVRDAPPTVPEFYEKFYSAVHDVLGLEENSDINGLFSSPSLPPPPFFVDPSVLKFNCAEKLKKVWCQCINIRNRFWRIIK